MKEMRRQRRVKGDGGVTLPGVFLLSDLSKSSSDVSLIASSMEVWVTCSHFFFITLEIWWTNIKFWNQRVTSKIKTESKVHNQISYDYKSSKQLTKSRNTSRTRRKVFWGISAVLRWSVLLEQYCFHPVPHCFSPSFRLCHSFMSRCCSSSLLRRRHRLRTTAQSCMCSMQPK